MNLDRHTYEAWLLDRLEGNLTAEQEERLDAFLAANPDLPIGPAELPQVPGIAADFSAKDLLKRTYPPQGVPDADRLDDFLVAKAEGDLDPRTLQALERYLFEHPEAARDARLIGLSKAMPDDGTFAGKSGIVRHFPPQGLPDAHRLTDFLIAALENDLTRDQRQALDSYLSAHPEVAREVRLVQATRLKAEAIRFAGRDTVERHFPPQGLPDAHRLVDFLIAAQENDLTTDQRQALDRWIKQHPEAQRAERLIALTRVPRTAVVYANKAGLRKRAARVIPLWTRLAAAASIVAVLGLGWWLMRNDGGRTEHGIAGTVKEQPSPRTPQQHMPAPTVPVEKQPASTTSSPDDIRDQGSASGKVPSAGSREPVRAPQQGTVQQPGTRTAPAPVQEPTPLPPQPLAPPEEEQPEPLMAEVAPTPAPAPQAVQAQPRTAAVDAGRSQTLGTFVANTVREGVLETAERPADLDQKDAVALVDKGLGALTGGRGGMQVHQTAKRERVQLRFGRNLAISASRGR